MFCCDFFSLVSFSSIKISNILNIQTLFKFFFLNFSSRRLPSQLWRLRNLGGARWDVQAARRSPSAASSPAGLAALSGAPRLPGRWAPLSGAQMENKRRENPRIMTDLQMFFNWFNWVNKRRIFSLSLVCTSVAAAAAHAGQAGVY